MHQDLLLQARHLARRDPGKPRQVNLRRAVSSAYYALFHAFVDEACRLMIGGRHGEAPFRHVLGRAFAHGTMKQTCTAFAGGVLKTAVSKGLPSTFSIPLEIRDAAGAFLRLQQWRHLADYDRTERFRRSDVLTLIDQVEAILNTFVGLPSSIEKKFFLICLLAWNTLAGC